MANQEQLDILKQGVNAWNRWRKKQNSIVALLRNEQIVLRPDLSRANLYEANLTFANLSGADLSEVYLGRANLRGADLSGADLRKADFSFANLSGANLNFAYLSGANLENADLSGANLSEVYLGEADFSFANLSGANLSGANLENADLSGANLSGADLSGADLTKATLVDTNLANTTLKDCRIYGISAWDVQLDGAVQLNLTITPKFYVPNYVSNLGSGPYGTGPIITVDNLKIAQFIYLLLNNKEIRDVIDTIAKKAVLILGRFTSERKVILDALRDALRAHGYLPILFDFDKPSSQDFTETVSTLAHLSRFIVADLTDPSSIPQELYAIVPHRMVPVQPLLKESEDPKHLNSEYSMFIDLRKKYHWVLSTYRYRELEDLLASLQAKVIDPAEQKAKELEKR